MKSLFPSIAWNHKDTKVREKWREAIKKKEFEEHEQERRKAKLSRKIEIPKIRRTALSCSKSLYKL